MQRFLRDCGHMFALGLDAQQEIMGATEDILQDLGVYLGSLRISMDNHRAANTKLDSICLLIG